MKKKILKRTLIIIGITILLILLIGTIAISIFTGKSMFEGAAKMNTVEQTIANGKQMLLDLEFDTQKSFEKYKDNMKEVKITSSKHKHTILADYILANGEKDNDTIILVHGLGGDRTTMYPIAKMFLDNGYNVLTMDQRNSGGNTAIYVTCGYLESDDVADCVDFIESNISKEQKIGMLGQSMGGATVGYYSGTKHANEHLDFAILDSPFNDMETMVSSFVSQEDTGVPIDYLMFCGTWATKFKLGFFYKDMNVANSIKNSTTPTIVIHSKTDDVCTYDMGEEIFNAIPHDNKKMITYEKGEHIMGFYDNEKKYTDAVLELVNQK